MAERCRWCGSGEMVPSVKRFEDGRTVDYVCCTWCGHVENTEGRRPTLAQRGQASLGSFA